MANISVFGNKWGVIDNAMHENTLVIDNKCVESAKKKLLMLREEFRAASLESAESDWKSRWWGALKVDDRRTLCVLAEVDDSDEFCARRWESISLDNKKKLAEAARHWARLMAPMRWS